MADDSQLRMSVSSYVLLVSEAAFQPIQHTVFTVLRTQNTPLPSDSNFKLATPEKKFVKLYGGSLYANATETDADTFRSASVGPMLKGIASTKETSGASYPLPVQWVVTRLSLAVIPEASISGAWTTERMYERSEMKWYITV